MVRHPNPKQLSSILKPPVAPLSLRGCLCLLMLFALAVPRDHGQHSGGTASPASNAASGQEARAQADGGASKTATAAQMRQQEALKSSADLLKMATDLKRELDKTSSETLSINVIRKAAEIERLAHSVRENLRLQALNN